MRRLSIFTGLSLAVLISWAVLHAALTFVCGVFAGPDGMYPRFTAVAYTLQASTALFLAGNFIWTVSGVLNASPRSLWRDLMASAAVLLAIAFSLFSLGVFRNRYAWLDRLLFGSDTYGYPTAMPGANSIAMAMVMWFILWVITRNKIIGYRRRDFLLVTVPSTLAALMVYLFASV